MSRSRKLLTAVAILTVGLVLSWPFRQTQDSLDPDRKEVDDIPRALNGDPIAFDSSDPRSQREEVAVAPVAPEHVSARMASTKESSEQSNTNQGLESFDLANHPAMQARPEVSLGEEPPSTVGSVANAEARPAYAVADHEQDSSSPDAWPQEVLHIVRNGDTLERLAERYLDDAGRGLEIFDLNRDQLSNPYLLPIGVELRIPPQASRAID